MHVGIMTLAVSGLLALVLSVILTAFCKTLAHRLRAFDVPRADRWRREPVPLLGGVAIFLAVLIPNLFFFSALNAPMRILLAGGSVIFILGLVDDFRPLEPRTKLIVQVLVAAALAALGLQLRLTSYPLLNVAFTLVWVVGIVNAFNLLDNMDGLAAGIAVIAGGFRLVLFLIDGNGPEALIAVIFIGATAGFLVYNLHPACIFMGDAGILFVGFYLAGLSLIGDWPYSRGIASVLVVPVLILLVPIFETTLVTVTRRLTHRRISEGGRDHTSHRLVVLGLSEQGAVMLLYAVALGSGFLALLSYRYGLSRTVVLIVFLGLGLAILGVRLAAVGPHLDDAARAEAQPEETRPPTSPTEAEPNR